MWCIGFYFDIPVLEVFFHPMRTGVGNVSLGS